MYCGGKNTTLANVTTQNIFVVFNVKEHLSIKAIVKATKWKIHMIKTTA